MSSPANKAKKWLGFVSRLAKQANFVCDRPIEVSFTNPEGSRVPVSDLSQLRQIFHEHGSDKNQLVLHLQSTDKEGVVHHTTVSIRRPASRSNRRRKEKSSATSASQSTSEDTSQESHQTTMSSSFVLRPLPKASPDSRSINISQSVHTTPRRRNNSQNHDSVSGVASMSLSPPKNATSVDLGDQPLEEEKQIPQPPPPPAPDAALSPPFSPPTNENQLSSQSNPLSLEEQRHFYYRQHGQRPSPSSLREGHTLEQEIPHRRVQYSHPPHGSPFVSPPARMAGPSGHIVHQGEQQRPGLPHVEEASDLTVSIRNLTTQLQSLIEQQQQQMATQTASAVAEVSALQNEVQHQVEVQAPPPGESHPPEIEQKAADGGGGPNVSHELGDKLDALSHHITQIGSVVERFNESAQLIHESVQNLMTTSLCIQQQQQHLSMSMSHMGMSTMQPSFMMTAVQTPQGTMYYPVAMDQKEPQMTPTPGPGAAPVVGGPLFRPNSLNSSFVSTTGTPILQAASPLQVGQRLPPNDHFAMGKSLTPTQTVVRHEKHFNPQTESPSPHRDHPASFAPAQAVRSVSVQDVLNSPRLVERTPPVRTSSARIVRFDSVKSSGHHSSSDPQAQQLVIVPPPQDSPKHQVEVSPGPGAARPAISASTGSLPSDVENAGSLRLSASGGSQDSGISEGLKEKLQVLKDMGYTNRTFNLVLLQQNNGDIDSVLADLKQFEQYK